MFPFLYDTKRDREDWGDFFCGPEQLDHSKETLIARFPRTGGDGHDVEVYVCALPARFYSVRVLPRQPEQYHEECNHTAARLGTGSGHEMAELARRLAQEIAAGMVNMEVITHRECGCPILGEHSAACNEAEERRAHMAYKLSQFMDEQKEGR